MLEVCSTYWCFTILIEVYLDAYTSYTAGFYRCRDKCTHTHSKYYNYINAYSLIPRPCRRIGMLLNIHACVN